MSTSMCRIKGDDPVPSVPVPRTTVQSPPYLLQACPSPSLASKSENDAYLFRIPPAAPGMSFPKL